MTGFDQIEEKDQNVASKAIGQPDKKRKLNNDEAAEEAIKNDADLTPEAKKIKLEELQKEKELKVDTRLSDFINKTNNFQIGSVSRVLETERHA